MRSNLGSGLCEFYRETSVCRDQSGVCFHTLVNGTVLGMTACCDSHCHGGALPWPCTLTPGSGDKSLRGHSARQPSDEDYSIKLLVNPAARNRPKCHRREAC